MSVDPQTLVEMQDEFDASVPSDDGKERAFEGVLGCYYAALNGSKSAQRAFADGGDDALAWYEDRGMPEFDHTPDEFADGEVDIDDDDRDDPDAQADHRAAWERMK